MTDSFRDTYPVAKKDIERRGLNQEFWVGEKEIRRYEYEPVYASRLCYDGLN